MDNLIELTPQQIAQLQSWLAEFDLDGLKLLSVTHLPDLDLLIIVDSTQGIVTVIAAGAFLHYGAIRETHGLTTIYTAYP